jgi:hypothetical protein
MQNTKRLSAIAWVFLGTTLALIASLACQSTQESKSTAPVVAAASDSSGSPIDVMCIGERINDPPEPFHYSYSYTDGSRSVNKEADITPQAMEITIKDSSGSHSYHGVRSNETSWNGAVLDLSDLNITVMSARLNSLNQGSAVKRQASEPINGYNATKYSVDTTSAGASDQNQFETLFGKGSFDKGTIWRAADSCVAKLVLDEGVWQQDGSIKKTHYEIARMKK